LRQERSAAAQFQDRLTGGELPSTWFRGGQVSDVLPAAVTGGLARARRLLSFSPLDGGGPEGDLPPA
jgi:hypothetical protein